MRDVGYKCHQHAPVVGDATRRVTSARTPTTAIVYLNLPTAVVVYVAWAMCEAIPTTMLTAGCNWFQHARVVGDATRTATSAQTSTTAMVYLSLPTAVVVYVSWALCEAIPTTMLTARCNWFQHARVVGGATRRVTSAQTSTTAIVYVSPLSAVVVYVVE